MAMKEIMRVATGAVLLASLTLTACAEPNDTAIAATENIKMNDNASSIQFTDIDGQPMPLSKFEGKVVLVVNTASKCGFTPQYAGLQKLWTDYEDKGLVVLGVPSPDFGNQELASETEVKSFCEINYGVNFPLTEKNHVIGAEAHPFFTYAEGVLGDAAKPRWNFHKILLDRSGTPVEAFASSVKPDDAKLLAAINAAL